MNTDKGINKSNDRKIKIIYGVELNVVNDEIDVVFGSSDEPIIGTTYVVFDKKTTDFNEMGED